MRCLPRGSSRGAATRHHPRAALRMMRRMAATLHFAQGAKAAHLNASIMAFSRAWLKTIMSCQVWTVSIFVKAKSSRAQVRLRASPSGTVARAMARMVARTLTNPSRFSRLAFRTGRSKFGILVRRDLKILLGHN